jgi:CBS domain-containing protein
MNSWIMRSVGDVLAEKGNQVWSISPDANLCDALKLMAEKQIGAVLVVEHNRPVGILSERDFARSAAKEDRSPRQIAVREIMSTNIVYVTLDKTVEDCMTLMTGRRMRHLPVLDGGRVIGLISIGDVVKWIITEQVGMIDQLERYIAGPNVTA